MAKKVTDILDDEAIHGDSSSRQHAPGVSIMDAFRYAPIIVAIVDAMKTGARVDIPPIRTWSPWGRRKLTITVEPEK